MVVMWSPPPTCPTGTPGATSCSSTTTSPACAPGRCDSTAAMPTASIRGRAPAGSFPTCGLKRLGMANSLLPPT
ncbi:hypothetical protein GBAR_LOCUS26586 [Geodia barretti]|uniref:Uncharacterized protein n=1 Tax=Geodia barretti TaxID=519541 RepID=A0AA35X7D0_GEOBA|nr:hypothetical protein GBAR_LOCUS26586 [Geodia barretti]